MDYQKVFQVLEIVGNDMDKAKKICALFDEPKIDTKKYFPAPATTTSPLVPYPPICSDPTGDIRRTTVTYS